MCAASEGVYGIVGVPLREILFRLTARVLLSSEGFYSPFSFGQLEGNHH